MKKLCVISVFFFIIFNNFAIPSAFAESKVYTLDGDFDEGLMVNVNHDPNHDQLQINPIPTPFPYIWVACSDRGTIVKIDVNTGEVMGEYLSAPGTIGKNPSRTTVDLHGNVWVGNRQSNSDPLGTGSVVKIGLIIGGTRVDADKTPNSDGQYLMPPFEYSEVDDRDGDGLIKTSNRLGNVLAWPDVTDGDGGAGGGPAPVEDAEDECIMIFQRTNGDHVRHVSVDSDNNVWVGCYYSNIFDLLEGPTGTILFTDTLDCGGYGGLIDCNGILWSGVYGPLRWDHALGESSCDSTHIVYYGLGIDTNGYIWASNYGDSGLVRKIDSDGIEVGKYAVDGSLPSGLAVTHVDNHVWVANRGTNNVTRLNNDGVVIDTISVNGRYPTGVAVDANGKVWVTNCFSHEAVRIDPVVGEVDHETDLNTHEPDEVKAGPYNYSDMTGMVVLGSTSRIGYWMIVYDGGWAGTLWDAVEWNGAEPAGTVLGVEIRTADAMIDLAGEDFQVVESGIPLSGVEGRYIEIRVTLEAEACSSETPVLYDLTVTYTKPIMKTHQEEFPNNTGETVYDLLMVIDPGIGGFPLADVIIDHPFPVCSTWVSEYTGLEYIHWSGAAVPPGDTAKACFETVTSGGKCDPRWKVKSKYWTDWHGWIIEFASPVTNWQSIKSQGDTVKSIIYHDWQAWTGDGWPPDPTDSLGAPMGPISGTQVYYAITDSFRSMEELNEDLYTDPAITWYPLDDFALSYGDSVTYDLVGDHTDDDVVLLRYVLSGEGLTARDILQVPVAAIPEIPTAVHVISFRAIEHDGYVEVEWTTATEQGNAGFNLYRSEGIAGVKVKLNEKLIPARGNELEGATYTFTDHNVAGSGIYYYWFEDVSMHGETRMNGPVLAERRDTPTAFSLAQNYPNPFNPITEIKYSLAGDCHVRLDIYNILGQRIATLVDGHEKAGYRTARWEGTNADGADVSSGVYFYRLEAGAFTDTKKMVLLR